MVSASVVDELFARRKSQSAWAPKPTGAPPSANPMQLTDLSVDQLAMIVARVLQVDEEPRGDVERFTKLRISPRNTRLARLCNALRNLRLVNAELNQPVLLEHTFEQISKEMRIDPVEVAHRVGEVNGDYLDRVRAVLRAKCDFASKISQTHSDQELILEVRDAAVNALYQSNVGGREDNFQTHAERMARCLWFCGHAELRAPLLQPARALILAGWDDEVLTLANLSNPEYTPTTVTLKALEHLFAVHGSLKHPKDYISAADYSKLVLCAASCNRPSAVEVLIRCVPQTLHRSALRRALAYAVQHSSGRLLVALASREALARNSYGTPEYVMPEDMMLAYSVARSKEQKQLLYLPSLDEAPNIFYDPDASPQELAVWKANWRVETDRGLDAAATQE
jgi:hypothetical protein